MNARIAILFPGQGSQKVGMGKALAEAYPISRQTFEEADEALGMSLSSLCFEGPEEALRRTEITQPALLTVSIAAYRAAVERLPALSSPALAAGHSLGEWTALVAVGGLRFADAVRAVRERGRLMQEAVPEGVGAMAAVLGLEPDRVRELCAEVERDAGGELVRPANFNSTEQTVISGHAGAVAKAGAALKAAGAMKIVPLPVSAPFHSPLMQPAAEGLRAVLASIAVGALAAPVVTNVEAEPNQDASRVKELLVAQMTAPVRWVEITRALVAAGVLEAIEFGPGKVLGGLCRRVDKTLKVHAVEDPASLDKTLDALAAQ